LSELAMTSAFGSEGSAFESRWAHVVPQQLS